MEAPTEDARHRLERGQDEGEVSAVRRMLVKASLVAALLVAAVVFGQNGIGAGSTAHAQTPEPTATATATATPTNQLQIVVLTPDFAQSLLQAAFDSTLKTAAPVFGFDARDGLNATELCFLAFVLRTANGGNTDEITVPKKAGDPAALPCGVVSDSRDAGGSSGKLKPADYSLLEPLGAKQLNAEANSISEGLFIIAFVKHGPVTFTTTAGRFLESNSSTYICDTAAEDTDCTNSFVANPITGNIDNDQIVVGTLVGPLGGAAPHGKATVTVDDGFFKGSTDVTFVGDPAKISLTLALKSSVEEGGDAGRPAAGKFYALPDLKTTFTPTNACKRDFSGLLAVQSLGTQPPFATVVVGVQDADGTGLTRVPVHWTSDDPTLADVAFDQQFSLSTAGLFVGPNLVCSGALGHLGTTTIHAKVYQRQSGELVGGFGVPEMDTDLKITVVGAPSQFVITADPPTLACDGTATTTLTAHLDDAFANPVTDGIPVHFDAQALGSVDPVQPLTKGGVATTTLAPLATNSTGVSVSASSRGLSASILIPCTNAAAAPGGGAAPPPSGPGGTVGGTNTGTITAPNTGTGGVAAGSLIAEELTVALLVVIGFIALGVGTAWRLKRAHRE